MINQPIIELDVHGRTADEAIKEIESAIHTAGPGVYRIRVIHGFHRGTSIQKAIYREIGYGLNPKVLRIIPGGNQGTTELILREYY